MLTTEKRVALLDGLNRSYILLFDSTEEEPNVIDGPFFVVLPGGMLSGIAPDEYGKFRGVPIYTQREIKRFSQVLKFHGQINGTAAIRWIHDLKMAGFGPDICAYDIDMLKDPAKIGTLPAMDFGR